MTTINRSALVPYTREEMYELVFDVESYPHFMPWCSSSEVLSRDEDEIRATIDMSVGGVQKSFTTRNRYQDGKVIEIQLVEGPFKCLHGCWRFDSLGDDGCKIALDMEYEFDSKVLGSVVGPIFNKIANTLIHAFLERAISVYGER